MVARLILDPAGPDERAFELRKEASTIGRTRDNDVFVVHPSLSRHHARLLLRGGLAIIEDLGSKNGTFVDGVSVHRRELHGSCLIGCGDVVLAFEPGADRPAAPTSGAPTLVFDGRSSSEGLPLGELLEKGRDPGMTALQLRDQIGEQRAQARLSVLLQVSELLSSPAAIDEVLARILDLAFEILEIDRATLLLCKGEGTVAEPQVWRTRQAEGAAETGAEAVYSRQIVSYVMDQGVSALFSDT
ncbi:MAG: hypothetical protein DRI90_28445, partial [Deltaproteobacteria bacterium]